MRDKEREAEPQAEGEAGSMQGAQSGTPSWISRITPWDEGGSKPLSHPGCPCFSLLTLFPILLISVLTLFFLRFYLFMRDTEREAETQAEGEAGSMQGAQSGTQSQVSRTRPWAEGGAKPLSHLGCPQ